LQIELKTPRPSRRHATTTILRQLHDGRVLRAPLWCIHVAERSGRGALACRAVADGRSLADIDEDISIASILRGQKAPGRGRRSCEREAAGPSRCPRGAQTSSFAPLSLK